MVKLNKVQVAVLCAARDAAPASIGYSAAARIGASGRTLEALVDREYLVRRKFATGNAWEITEAGRAYLSIIGESA